MIQRLGELSTPLDFSDLFGRSGPVEIEIGMGKGRFLRERAQAEPDRNFLGIEKSLKWLKYAEIRLKKAQLANVRLFHCYVEGFLETYLPSNSVAAYHVYFPDPWPKKRHHKRRLFSESFLGEIHRTLLPQGSLFFATDHEQYFRVISDCFTSFPQNKLEVDLAPQIRMPQSNYEVKYRKEGRPIYYLQAEKSSDLPG